MEVLNICDIDEANNFLPGFMERFNAEFGVEPAMKEDASRKVLLSEETIDLILSTKEIRTLSKNLEFQYKNHIYQIEGEGQGRRLSKKEVEVRHSHTGETLVVYKWMEEGKEKERLLKYKILGKVKVAKLTADYKQINCLMETIIEREKVSLPKAAEETGISFKFQSQTRIIPEPSTKENTKKNTKKNTKEASPVKWWIKIKEVS